MLKTHLNVNQSYQSFNHKSVLKASFWYVGEAHQCPRVWLQVGWLECPPSLIMRFNVCLRCIIAPLFYNWHSGHCLECQHVNSGLLTLWFTDIKQSCFNALFFEKLRAVCFLSPKQKPQTPNCQWKTPRTACKLRAQSTHWWHGLRLMGKLSSNLVVTLFPQFCAFILRFTTSS